MCNIAKQYGKATWQSRMARLYYRAVWQGHMAAAAALRVRFSMETFSHNFQLKKRPCVCD